MAKIQISFRAEEKLKEDLMKLAQQEKRSLSNLIEKLLSWAVVEEKAKQQQKV